MSAAYNSYDSRSHFLIQPLCSHPKHKSVPKGLAATVASWE